MFSFIFYKFCFKTYVLVLVQVVVVVVVKIINLRKQNIGTKAK